MRRMSLIEVERRGFYAYTVSRKPMVIVSSMEQDAYADVEKKMKGEVSWKLLAVARPAQASIEDARRMAGVWELCYAAVARREAFEMLGSLLDVEQQVI